MAVAALAATAILGFAAVRIALGGGSTRVPAAAITTGAPAPSPAPVALEPGSLAGATRTVGGIPEGFAHSRRGAAAAAANYLAALEQALPAGAASWSSAVRALTVAPLTAQALDARGASTAIAARIAASAGPAFIRGWRLGYRIDSYTPSRARVAVWTVGLVASVAQVVPAEYSSTECTLRWLSGDWKVARARTTPGPTPPADASDAAAVEAFARAALAFRSYGDAS